MDSSLAKAMCGVTRQFFAFSSGCSRGMGGSISNTSAAAAAAADATSELVSVRPARALDVFDMSTSQDLISFTLGGEHNADNAPESLEIKSTRQVSKAEPVEPAVAEKLIDEARAVKAADDAKAVSAGNAVDTEPEQRDDADTDADDEAANAAQRAAFHELSLIHI